MLGILNYRDRYGAFVNLKLFFSLYPWQSPYTRKKDLNIKGGNDS